MTHFGPADAYKPHVLIICPLSKIKAFIFHITAFNLIGFVVFVPKFSVRKLWSQFMHKGLINGWRGLIRK